MAVETRMRRSPLKRKAEPGCPVCLSVPQVEAILAFSASWPKALEQEAKAFCYVHPCLVHGKSCGPAEPNHFPRTKASGQNKSRCMMIPLCRTAHNVFHNKALYSALDMLYPTSEDLRGFLERLLVFWAALATWLWEHREDGKA